MRLCIASLGALALLALAGSAAAGPARDGAERVVDRAELRADRAAIRDDAADHSEIDGILDVFSVARKERDDVALSRIDGLVLGWLGEELGEAVTETGQARAELRRERREIRANRREGAPARERMDDRRDRRDDRRDVAREEDRQERLVEIRDAWTELAGASNADAWHARAVLLQELRHIAAGEIADDVQERREVRRELREDRREPRHDG